MTKAILFALIAICLLMSTVAIVIGDPGPPPPPPSPSTPVSSTPTAAPITSSVPVSSTPVSDPVVAPVDSSMSDPVAPSIDVPIATPVSPPIELPIGAPINAPVDVPVATSVPVSIPVAPPVTTPTAVPVPVPVATPITVPVSAPIPTPVAAPVAVPDPVASQFVGCFEDSASRDLPFKAYTDAANTNVRCISNCSAAGYAYAATQNGNECWCGNSYGSKGVFNAKMCNMACTGDRNQYCGSGYRNSVYRTPSRYIGCYQDSSNRDLKFNGYYGYEASMTEKCNEICRTAGFLFAGSQTGNECWCGNSYGSQGRLANYDCNVLCSGNPTQYSSYTCGGAYRNAVYRV